MSNKITLMISINFIRVNNIFNKYLYEYQNYRIITNKYPIIQAGMVWVSGWKLASAVSNYGGLGINWFWIYEARFT